MEAFARGVWRCRAPLSVLCLLGVYVLLLPFGWMCVTTARYRTSAAKVPATAVGVIFGAGAPDGEPSPMLVGRLQVGLDLYPALPRLTRAGHPPGPEGTALDTL